MLNNTCPLPTILPDMATAECPQKFGQIQRIAFRLIQKGEPEAGKGFSTEEDVINKAIWDSLLTASDKTKIVLSPLIPNIVIPQSELQTAEGNTNVTIDGISEMVGESNPNVTGQLRNTPVEVAEKLKALNQFSNVAGATMIEAFLFNEHGQILYKLNEAGKPEGFPIYNFFVSTVGSEGFGAPNIHNVSWELKSDWDKDLKIGEALKAGKPQAWNPVKL